MPINVQQRGARFQLRVRHKLLPRAFFFTFDTKPEATTYGQQLETLLDRGIVPSELLAQPVPVSDPLVVECVRQYLRDAPVTDSDSELLGVLLSEVVGVRLSSLTPQWVDAYVSGLKLGKKKNPSPQRADAEVGGLKLSKKKNLSPGTIRKRVGALGRVIDWHMRQVGSSAQNPFRTLPAGYSTYSRADAERALAEGGEARRDVTRDRRLHPGEEPAILDALAGIKNPERQRALVPDPELALMFRLIVNCGLRLREAYRLRIDAIDVGRRLIAVDGSKGARGVIKHRTVPVSSALMADLVAHIGARTGLVFSFWSGLPDDMKRVTGRLSARFASVFDYAGCKDLTEHDLRHEATCRWVTLRAPGGGWLFSETEVCKIMGWSDTRMILRYASLRGEDLSSRLA